MRSIRAASRCRLARAGGSVLLLFTFGCGVPHEPLLPTVQPLSRKKIAQLKPVSITYTGTTAMHTVTFPKQCSFNSFANRGILNWNMKRPDKSTSLTCSFRSLYGGGAHYGGLSLPLVGDRAFRLTVTMLEGASAVKAVHVRAVHKKTEAGRWGFNVRGNKWRLQNKKTYIWEFYPGGARPEYFWNIPGEASSFNEIHLFFDVDPNEKICFRLDRVECEATPRFSIAAN